MRRLLPTSRTAWHELLTAHENNCASGPKTIHRRSPTSMHWCRPRSPASKGETPMRCVCTSRRFSRRASTASSRTKALAHELAARFYAARGFETIAHAYLQDRAALLSSLGRARQGAAARPALPAAARGIGSVTADRDDRRAHRAAGRRDGGQGLAGGVGRDRTRQAHRDAHEDRGRACGRRSGPAHPSQGRRAADRGGGDDRPRQD